MAAAALTRQPVGICHTYVLHIYIYMLAYRSSRNKLEPLALTS